MDFPVGEYLSEGADAAEAIASPKAVGVLRINDEDDLNPALAKCENVRSIWVEADIATLPSWFARFKRLRELSITSYALTSLPKWLTELPDLRHLSLDRCSDLKKIPEHVWRIPRLESLWLFHTTFDKLDGIEKAPALRELIVFSDELLPHLPAMAKRLQGTKGVASVKVDGNALRIERKSTARLPGSAKKAAAILSSLPRGFDCRGVDLRGQTFEDIDIEVDLRKAKLDGTTWRRCRFLHTDMAGASAAKAVFDHCHFEGSLRSLKAPGITFRQCDLNGPMEGADFQAAVIETTPDSFLRLAGAKLERATILATFTTPQNGGYVDLSKADLRGAKVTLGLTTEAAARLAKSKTRFAWKKANTKGAKVDKQTSVVHRALDQKSVAKPVGAVATNVGTLCGGNAACWFVIADANVARGWKGSQLDDDYEELPKTDFSRALSSRFGPIAIGKSRGVLADVGDCGCSRLWVDGPTWCLLYAHEGEDVDRNSKAGQQLIGARVAQLPAKRTTKVGRFDVHSGCMTLLLPHRENPFTEKQIVAARKAGKVVGIPNDHDALLVPVDNGSYEVTSEDLSKHSDDVGTFYTRIRISRRGAVVKP